MAASPRLARCLLVLLALSSAPAASRAAGLWFVDAAAAPGGDGSSWATALSSLDDAFAAALPGDQVWVAAGRYTPSQPTVAGDPRTAWFELPDLVEVYGGFRGDEASLAERAGLFEATVLSGDLGVLGDPSDNAYHVVRFASDFNYHASARLDGFLITGGRGERGRHGGGLLLTATAGPNSWAVLFVDNCTFRGNASWVGGGLAVDNQCRLRLRRCTVADNHADLDGGGAKSTAGWLASVNTTWAGNTAGRDGGAIHANATAEGTVRFVNDVFHDNRARRGGVALLRGLPLLPGAASFLSCTLAYNSAVVGGAIAVDSGGQLKASNSIVWANRALLGPQLWTASPAVDVRFCDVEGGLAGTGNLDVEPLFRDPAGRDLRTIAGSPVHDVGSNSLLPPDSLDLDDDGDLTEPLPLDRDDTRRRTEDPAAPGWVPGALRTDMGAYEL